MRWKWNLLNLPFLKKSKRCWIGNVIMLCLWTLCLDIFNILSDPPPFQRPTFISWCISNQLIFLLLTSLLLSEKYRVCDCVCACGYPWCSGYLYNTHFYLCVTMIVYIHVYHAVRYTSFFSKFNIYLMFFKVVYSIFQC